MLGEELEVLEVHFLDVLGHIVHLHRSHGAQVQQCGVIFGGRLAVKRSKFAAVWFL